MKKLQRIVSMLLVMVITFTTVNMNALAGMLKLPAQLKVIQEEAFWATSIASMQIPDAVELIESRAFANCEQLHSVYFPDHDIIIADDAFDGSDSVCFYVYPDTTAEAYALARNIPVVYLANDLTINSITADVSECEVGRTITWTVQTSGVEQKAYYSYSLYTDDLLVSTSDYTARNYYTYTAETAGRYTLLVSCYDASGVTVEASADVVVVNRKPSSVVDVIQTGEAFVEGDTLSWNFELSEPSAEAVFDIQLKRNDEVIVEQSGLTTQSFSYSGTTAGEYVLTVECVDLDVHSTVVSTPVTIYTQDEVWPAAPVLLPASDLPMPAAEQQSAPTYPSSEPVYIAWEAVEQAYSYGVELAVQNGTEWVAVCEEKDLVENKFAFSSDLFTEVSQSTLYRLGVYSIGIANGEAGYWYFCVEPETIDQSITVNGQEKVYWDQLADKASKRYFSVTSEGAWTATTSAEWLTIELDSNGFTLYMEENPLSLNERTANVYVTNAYGKSATVAVWQGYKSSAATIEGVNWSQDPSAPTTYPAGGLFFEVNTTSYDVLNIYQKLADNTFSLVHSQYTDGDVVVPEGILKSDSLYCLEISSHVNGERYQTSEVEEDTLKTRYYLNMSADGHVISVGSGSNQYTMYETTRVMVRATNLWSVISDAEWLQCNAKQELETYVYIKVEENQTGTERVGHLTFTCGSEKKTLTIKQPDTTPKLLLPTGLSTKESAPTILPYNTFTFQFIGHTLDMEYLVNGTYTDVGLSYWSSALSMHQDTITKDDFSAGTYRITVSIESGESVVYYVKFSSSTSAYIRLNGNEWYEWSSGYEQSTTNVTLTSSGSWTAMSDSDWLTVSSKSGSSSKSLTITATVNTGDSERVGIITFKRGSYATAYLYVVQAAQTEEYLMIYDDETSTLTNQQYAMPVQESSSHTVSLEVHANDTWTATSNASWLTIKSTTATKLTLSMTANTFGAELRTGVVTLKSGTQSLALVVKQAPPLEKPDVTTFPSLSTDHHNPSLIEKDDIIVTWPKVSGAVRYGIKVGLLSSYNVYVNDDGSSSYTYTIPQEWLPIHEEDDYGYFRVSAYDEWGFSTLSDQFNFSVTLGTKPYVDGSADPIWENATDIPVSRVFTVRSKSNWTATAQQSWIALDKLSGLDGENVTISLDENTGSARNGQVIFACGSEKTILNISQCGMLEEYPQLNTPVFSENEAEATTIDVATTSMNVTWNVEPQASYYEVFISKLKTNTSWTTIADSDVIYDSNGSYTFENLELEAGQLYRLWILRRCDRWGTTGKSYYFAASDENAYVLLDGSESALFEGYYGAEDYERYTVTSSGSWVAEASDEWILVGNRHITQETLTENNRTPGSYSTYLGQAGVSLFISLLENQTGETRTGSVMVRCGTSVAVVEIVQEPYYKPAEIIAPVLGSSSNEAVKLPYEKLVLSWNVGEGGNGLYTVELDTTENGRTYNIPVKSWKNISTRSLTIPLSYFEENTYYRIKLFTDVDGLEDYYPYEAYYFYIGSANELVVSSNADWSKAQVNGQVDISANASGGADGYRYAYELLLDGKQEYITEWGTWDSYTFPILKPGTYQVRTYVRDSSNEQTSILSEEYMVDEEIADSISLSRGSWAVDPNGDSTTVTVYASDGWTVTSNQSWVTVNKADATTASISCYANAETASREAKITFTCGSASVSMLVTQNGKVVVLDELYLSQTTWDIATYNSQILELTITSTSPWYISNRPEWITPNIEAAAGNAIVTLVADENEDAARNGVLIVSTSENECALTITQSGIEVMPRVLNVTSSAITPLLWQVVDFEVVTQNATSVQLVVDGKTYETYPVTNNVASFSRAFSQSGMRKVQFLPVRDGSFGAPSDATDLEVICYGDLLTPTFKPITQTDAGVDLTVSWESLENASYYDLTVNQGTQTVYSKSKIKQTTAKIPGKILGNGSYVFTLKAYGYGYRPSEVAIIVTFSTPTPSLPMNTIPNSMLQPEEPPKSQATDNIERLIESGQKAGTVGSSFNLFLNKLLLDRTLADVLAGIVINDYVEGSGWVDAGIEAIILTLTDIVGTAGDVNKDFGAELFREVAMSIMGKGNLPDMNAAAEKNLLYVAKDAAELYKELDEFIFFNDVHLSGWDVYFNEFAETLGYVDVDVFGKVTVLNQRSYDELRNIFKMRKQSDLESLNDHINGMLERWAKDGQCIVEEGFEPRFAYDVKGNICPEGETYAAITKMRNTAESVQKNVKRIGKIADVIGNIADAVSIVSSVSQKVNQLEKIRESYTRNRQFLWAVIQHSKGDSEAVAIQLLSDLQGDFAAEKNNAVFEVLADYGTEKIVEKVIETIDDFAGTSIIGGILAGGQIAGMVPLVQDAKELIDCKQLLIGWAAVKEELDGALERAMKSSSPYTVYLAELYIEWNMKGLEIAEKYFDILRSHRFIVGTSNAQQADEMINRIKEEMLTFRTSYSVPLWNKHF